jgi:hypothetical protein
MSKFSLSVYLNAYSDPTSSNNPGMNNFKWNRDLNSIIVNNPINQAAAIAPGETRSLFSGVRVLAQDGTTQYSISLKPLSTNTYVLANVSGTAPNFRTPRVTGADATTQVTTQTNGPIVTFTSTGGTLFSLAGVSVGDFVSIGNLFNILNQGTFQIIAKTAASFTIENPVAVNEGPITLGAGFASQIAIFSAAGVQINDTLVISSGFSQATWGSYEITAVYAESLEFSSTAALPQETGILSQPAIYSNAKSLVYLESDSALNVIVNGVTVASLEPFIIPNASQPSFPPTIVPGPFLLKATVYSLSVQNSGINPANVFFAAVE